MNDQVLSIEKMQELKKLGIDTSKASMYYEKLPTGSVYLNISDEYKERLFWTVTENGIEYIPTFTLQDLLNILPHTLCKYDEYVDDELHYTLSWYKFDTTSVLKYENTQFNKELNNIVKSTLLEAAFNMLKWCKQNNYI